MVSVAPRPRPPALRLSVGVGVVALLTAAHLAYYFPRVVDDLYISLRYADNIAHGKGAVYNVGERVEGYSSALWLLLQTVGASLGVEGVTWTKGLGVLSLVATQVSLFLVGRRVLRLSPVASLLPCAAAAANPYLIAWSVLGLETPLFLALLVSSLLTVRAAAEGPSPRRIALSALHLVALLATRPEAPLYVACALGLQLLRTEAGSPRQRLRSVGGVSATVAISAGALLLLRHAYYGLWLPHTYYVKGAGVAFDVERLAPLVTQGASPAEAVFYCGGFAALAAFAWRRRALEVPAYVLCCLYFTASVETDWMPSLRHLLPVTLLVPFGWAALLDALAPARGEGRGAVEVTALRAVAAGALVFTFVSNARVDSRYSPNDRRDHGWVLLKSRAKWGDAVLAYRKVEPPHVASMDDVHMGQISQTWTVLEASAEPVDASWYVGRDIGAVGYLTGVRVFDTAGLFTPTVVRSAPWRVSRAVSPELIGVAMALRPLGAELFDGWDEAAGAHPDLLRGYSIVSGDAARPNDVVASDRPPPDEAEVERRYRAVAARVPSLFHLQTLYGENMGATIGRRARVLGHRHDPPGATEATPASLDGGIESVGCTVTPDPVKRGSVVVVRCPYRALATARRGWRVFLHFEGPAGHRFQGDHDPVPKVAQWVAGERYEDTSAVTVPATTGAGTYRLYYGLWEGDDRAAVTPSSVADGRNRVRGPSLEVTP